MLRSHGGRRIDVFQDMISLYLEKGKVRECDKEELEAIKEQLDVLYISW